MIINSLSPKNKQFQNNMMNLYNPDKSIKKHPPPKNSSKNSSNMIKPKRLQTKHNHNQNDNEEEKVPSEHPIKRHSIGLNFYQTNYFSQPMDDNLKQKKNNTLQSDEEEKDLKNSKLNNSYSNDIKQRKPTIIPYNSPGDYIDNVKESDDMVIKQNKQLVESYYTFSKFNQQEQFQGGFQDQIINQIEKLKYDLEQKDIKMQKMFIEMRQLRQENKQIKIKLQHEARNNALLMNNLNKFKHGYIYQNSRSNQIEQIQPRRNNRNQEQRRSNLQNSQQQLRQNMQMSRQLISPKENSQYNVSFASESNQSANGNQLEQPPAQSVHIFQPPTRASQGLRMQQRNFSHQQQNYQQQFRRNLQRNQIRSSQQNEEEASLYDTQYNEESILINKVNEMQIKTSRFDQQVNQNQQNDQQMNNRFYGNMLSEDFIPNEEPLINVREFWGNNQHINYRMRFPYQVHHQNNMRLQNIVQHHVHHFHHGQNKMRNYNVFNNQRRHDQIEEKVRGNSLGPPLTNIFGDCQSCLEEDNDGHQISHSQMPRRHVSDDSFEGFEEEEKHHHLPLNHQMFHYNFNNINGNIMNRRFSVDDGGMDEYDVADERQHLFEIINPDNMSYEELLALQERIGFVSKGLSREKVKSFPVMKKSEVVQYLGQKQKKKISIDESLSKLQVKNPLEENKKQRSLLDYEDDGIIEDDEGFINRELPINIYSNQVKLDEEGQENCKEEDEERKRDDQLNKKLGQRKKQMKNIGDQEGLQQSQIMSMSSCSMERCAICFEGMRNQDYIKLLTCQHYYHQECIDQWLILEKRCPMCMIYLDS